MSLNFVDSTDLSYRYLNQGLELYRFTNSADSENLLAFGYFTQAAELGNHWAEYVLGVFYLTGDIFPVNHDLVLKFFKRASDSGVHEAMFELGLMYYLNKGAEGREVEGIRLIQNSANLENDAAEYWLEDNFIELARCFSDGWCVIKNYKMALFWLDMAIEFATLDNIKTIQTFIEVNEDIIDDDKLKLKVLYLAGELGVLEAQLKIAEYLYLSSSSEMIQSKAFYWFKKAAQQGSDEALMGVAQCYEFGVGIRQDQLETNRIYKILAHKGNAEAAFKFADRLSEGVGFSNDEEEKALVWYKIAAKAGHTEAQFTAAELMEDDPWESIFKGETITAFYGAAAKNGHIEAKFKYAIALENGTGIDENCKLARQFYLDAAEKDHTESMYRTAQYDFSDEQYDDALYWYEKSANMGHQLAQFKYAECLYYGHGVEKNTEQAEQYYFKAAETNHVESLYSLGFCYAYHNDDFRVQKNSLDWFKKAALYGHAGAMRELGNCFLNGTGVVKKTSTARRWYQDAKSAGCKTSTETLNKLDDWVWCRYEELTDD